MSVAPAGPLTALTSEGPTTRPMQPTAVEIPLTAPYAVFSGQDRLMRTIKSEFDMPAMLVRLSRRLMQILVVQPRSTG